jgi:homogentisate 1,2-dioxygenase
MVHYRSVGVVPRRRHTLASHREHRLHEELMGEEGFSGASSLLYHLHSPSALVAIEPFEPPMSEAFVGSDDGLRPRHLRTGMLAAHGDAVTARVALAGNDDVVIAYTRATESSPLFRDALGDELVYVQAGAAVLESSYGALPVSAGDYVVVPASTIHRWRLASAPESPFEALIFMARGHVQPPSRYRNRDGQFIEATPYNERDLRAPASPMEGDAHDVPVLVRHRNGWSRHVHAYHPFDVVGWDGCVYPYALSIHDFAPIVGTLHQPPPVHQTFEGPGMVVCSFVPRPYDFHPDAVKVPYHHANVDSDEVLFYSDGDFMSRAGSGVARGSLTLHPAGFVHGPQPGSYERSVDATRTEELAVMLDTFRPLILGSAASDLDDPDYWRSWAGPQPG